VKLLLLAAPADRHPEHPLLVLHRLYPLGSQADELARLSPSARDIDGIVNSQPDETETDDYPELKATRDQLLAPLTTKAPGQVEEPLGESLQKLVSGPMDVPAPVVEQPRTIYQPIKPLAPQDFGREPL
jgi:hypothetical protein